MKVCVLLSGGMDSTVALYDAHKKHEVITAVSFDYGSKHNEKEIAYAKQHSDQLGIEHLTISLDFINALFQSDLLQSGGEIPEGHYAEENMKSTVVPFRNGIMLSIAAGLAESKQTEGLVIAAHSGDHAIYPDCRESFMRGMAEAIQQGTYAHLQVLRPFIDIDKTEIVRRGAALGVDFSQTWSCYKGQQQHCGACGTCIERREAFLLANLTDPTSYVALPPIPTAPTIPTASAE